MGTLPVALLWLIVWQDAPPASLLEACASGTAAEVRGFLGKGADVNAAGEDGETPLLVAARRGAVGILKVLLAAGAKADVRRWNGESVLHAAVASKNADALALLLTKFRELEAADNRRGQTALHYAAAEGRMAMVQQLLAAGAKVDARSRGGVTPLWLAAQGGHDETVTALLAAGAAADESGPEGYRPIHLAARACRPALIEALLKAHAAVSSATASGSTPLHVAVEQNCLPAAQRLVEAGADGKAVDGRAKTALDIARRRRLNEIVQFLEKKENGPKP